MSLRHQSIQLNDELGNLENSRSDSVFPNFLPLFLHFFYLYFKFLNGLYESISIHAFLVYLQIV